MKILTDINLNGNQILNSVVHTTVIDPPDEVGKKAGKLIYNSTDNKLKYAYGNKWHTLKTTDIESEIPYCTFLGEIEADQVTGEEVIKELIKYDGSDGSRFEDWLSDFKKQNGYNAYDSTAPFVIVYQSAESMETVGSTAVAKTNIKINVQCKLLSKTEQIIYTNSGNNISNAQTYYRFQMNVIDSVSKQTEAIIELAVVNNSFQYSSVKAYTRTISDYKNVSST